MTTTLTFTLMDPPFETERSTTAFRLMQISAERGYNINVFAYEGAVYLPFSKQVGHANAFHEHSVEEENHPLTKEWVVELQKLCATKGGKLDWVNCGLCVDERGAQEAVDGIRRGSPADLLEFIEKSDGNLVIATR